MIRTSGPVYLRPGNLFKDFTIEPKNESTTARGRVTASYDKESAAQLRAVLADATTEEKEQWEQQQHPITHVLTQQGSPRAGAGDRLVLGDQLFYVQGVNNAASLDIWTLYYVQERSDTNGD